MPFKKIIQIALACVFISTKLFSQTDNEGSYYHKDIFGLNGSINAGVTSTGNSGTGANINVVYHRCNWIANPDDATKTLTGNITTYFTTTVNNVSTISFDFNETSFNNASLQVLYHGSNCSFSFPSSGNIDVLNITLPSTIISTGTLDSITIKYVGIPPAATTNTEGYQRKQDASSNNYIYTLSESYEDKDWWPCKADMQDKVDSIDINVTVPSAFWVAANGVMTDSAIIGSNRIFKFKHRYPIASYLVSIAIAKYKKYYLGNLAVGTSSVPFVVNLFPNKTTPVETNILNILNNHKLVFAAFNTLFGDYPFAKEKHGFYEFGFSGGMEHQTFSGIGTSSFQSNSVLAHELAHQWWGDKVTFATWNHLWLAEGFATYSESLAAEFVPSIGINPANKLANNKSNARTLTNTATYINPVNNSNEVWTNNNTTAVYDRGCMIVSMLRTLMGDTKFFNACKSYLNDTSIAYKAATTVNLQQKMEAEFGESMTNFFTEWVTKNGIPNYNVQWGNVGNTINIKLTQSITATTSTGTSVASTFFPMPVVIKISNATNTADTTIVIYHKSANVLMYAGNGVGSTVNSNIISYNLSFTPANITFDPDNKTMANATINYSAALPIANIHLFANTKNKTDNITASIAGIAEHKEVILEKSFDGIHFYAAGKMEFNIAQNNAIIYTLTQNSSNNTVYYRASLQINQVTLYSNIIIIYNKVFYNNIQLQPNPAKDYIKIIFSNPNNEKVAINITNVTGKLIQTSTTNSNTIQLNCSHYIKGNYFVQLIKNNEIIGNESLIIE